MNKNSIALIIVISISILLVIFYQDPIDSLDLSKPPSIVSILPPVIAIAAAFLLRQVVVALFLGIWFGAWALNGGDFSAVLTGLVDVTNKYAVNAMVNRDHAVIILASVFIGGLMSVLSVNGSMQAIVKAILRRVVTIKHVQLSTFCMGLIIFFDDYANALVTGNVMRPVTDKMKISREKLAYIVDSTAAPVAAVAVISLWIGFLVSLIETSIENIASLSNPYGPFIESIAYSFYPFLAIIFVLIVIISGKDFGPMLSAERKALAGELNLKQPSSSQEPARSAPASIAIVSILVLIATVILGMLYTGSGESLHEIIGSSDSLAALMFGAFLSSLVAIVFSLLKTSLTLAQIIEAWLVGVNTVIGAVVILILSWSLAEVVKDMQSANYIIFLIGNDMSPAILPTIIFVLSGLVALGTGTSWGAMAIIMPLAISLSWSLINNPIHITGGIDIHILYASIAAVLAGAVWGDHCSPISDTTILSSLASQCDHISHVRTQMPYALLVGVVAICLGILPASFGFPWWACFMLSTACLWLVMKVFGQPH